MITLVIVGAVLALVYAMARSCSGPGEGVAQRIRESGHPLIEDVGHAGPNPYVGQRESVSVRLVREATEADGIHFWCTVIRPAGGESVNVSLFGGDYPARWGFTTAAYSDPEYRHVPACP